MTFLFTVVPQGHVNVKLGSHISQVHFDQMNVMAHMHYTENHNIPAWFDSHTSLPANDSAIFSAMERCHIKPCFMRAFPQKQIDWMDWDLLEFKQPNQYRS